MLQEQSFFDNGRHWNGRGLLHQYETIKEQDQKTDHRPHHWLDLAAVGFTRNNDV